MVENRHNAVQKLRLDLADVAAGDDRRLLLRAADAGSQARCFGNNTSAGDVFRGRVGAGPERERETGGWTRLRTSSRRTSGRRCP